MPASPRADASESVERADDNLQSYSAPLPPSTSFYPSKTSAELTSPDPTLSTVLLQILAIG